MRDARTLRPLRRFPALAYAGAVSPDARTFAIGGQDGSVRFLDLRTGKLRTASGRHAGAVQSAVFTPDGRFLVTVGDDANAIVWDVARRAGDRDVPGPRRPRARGGRRPARAHALHRGPGRQRDRVGPRRGPAAGPAVPGRTGSGDRFPSTAISGDGRSLATLQDGGAVSLVDLATLTRRSLSASAARPAVPPAARPTRRPSVRAARSSSAASTASSRSSTPARAASSPGCADTATSSSRRRRARTAAVIASTGLDGTLRLWDARTARALGPPIRLGGPPASDASITPDGTRVAVSLAAGTDRRARRALAPALARLRVDDSTPTFSRFSRDGRYLLAGSKDGRVRVFTARDLRPLGPAFPAHDGSVSSVDASPDGRTLVTAGSDGQVRLWDLASRRPIGTPLPGPENINAVALFAPDGDARLRRLPRRPRLPLGRPRARRGSARPAQSPGAGSRRAEWHEALPGRAYAPAC